MADHRKELRRYERLTQERIVAAQLDETLRNIGPARGKNNGRVWIMRLDQRSDGKPIQFARHMQVGDQHHNVVHAIANNASSDITGFCLTYLVTPIDQLLHHDKADQGFVLDVQLLRRSRARDAAAAAARGQKTVIQAVAADNVPITWPC